MLFRGDHNKKNEETPGLGGFWRVIRSPSAPGQAGSDFDAFGTPSRRRWSKARRPGGSCRNDGPSHAGSGATGQPVRGLHDVAVSVP